MIFGRKTLVSILVTLVLLISVGCGGNGSGKTGSSSGQTGSTTDSKDKVGELKIGMTAALSKTGGTDFGLAIKQGMLLAIKEYNDKGGYKGTKISPVIYDDESNPEKAVQNFLRLIKEDKVIAITGIGNTGTGQAASQVAQENKVPVIVSAGSGIKIVERYQNEPKNYIFRVSMPDKEQIPAMLDYIQKKGWKKIGIAHDTAGYGTSGNEEATKQIKERGLTLVGSESYATGDTDMTSQLQKLKAAGAEVVIWYSSSPETARLMISRQKLGWNVPMVGPWAASGTVFPQLAGKAGVGLHLVQSFTPDKSDKAKEFDQKMQKEYGKDYAIPVVAAQSYDATNIILTALDQVGPDPEKIRDAIENMDNFNGIVGFPAKPFSKTKHDAIDKSSMFMGVYDENMKIIKAD